MARRGLITNPNILNTYFSKPTPMLLYSQVASVQQSLKSHTVPSFHSTTSKQGFLLVSSILWPGSRMVDNSSAMSRPELGPTLTSIYEGCTGAGRSMNRNLANRTAASEYARNTSKLTSEAANGPESCDDC